VCCRGLAGLKRIAGRVGGIRRGGGGEDNGITMLVRVGIAVTCSVVAYTVSYLTTRGGGTSFGSEEEEDLGNPALGNTTTGPAAAPGLVLPLLPSGTYQMKISLAHASLKQTIVPCPIQLPGHLQQQNPRVLEL